MEVNRLMFGVGDRGFLIPILAYTDSSGVEHGFD